MAEYVPRQLSNICRKAMKLNFEISPAEARKVRLFYRDWAEHPFVLTRHRRNVLGERPPVTRKLFWEAYVSALLTTQQRSGPGSAVGRFTSETPFPLSLGRCRRQRNPQRFIERSIREYGGIRRGPTIGEAAAAGLEWLEATGWSEMLTAAGALEGKRVAAKDERAAARLLALYLPQIGPKQSRNVLQMLGLTRHETPLDSRITRWLNDFGFPVRLSAASLADPDYYELVADGFQALCRSARILPCDLDAAIFVSFDEGAPADVQLRW